jgi:hypothetical protein
LPFFFGSPSCLFQADTDIAFSWGVKAPLDLTVESLPLQVQVRYTAPDGTKLLRVISRNLPASSDRNKTEAVVDTAVVSINAIHKSADLAHKGDYQVLGKKKNTTAFGLNVWRYRRRV